MIQLVKVLSVAAFLMSVSVMPLHSAQAANQKNMSVMEAKTSPAPAPKPPKPIGPPKSEE